MFSTAAMSPITCIGNRSFATSDIDAITAAAPLMSNFISSMPGRILQRDATRVKSDALADEYDRGAVSSCGAIVSMHDEARRLGAALRDGEQTAHLLFLDRRLVEYLHPQRRVLLAERARLVCEVGRRADVGRQIREVALDPRGAGYGIPVRDPRSASSTPALRTGPASTFCRAGGFGFLAVFRSLTRYRFEPTISAIARPK